MEEVDLKELFGYFIKRISIIIAIVVLCLITGVIYTMFIKTPLYKGDTSIILVNKSNILCIVISKQCGWPRSYLSIEFSLQ